MSVVTIVVPVKDRPDQAIRAIESALASDPSPAEIIVVDSGSEPDNRARIKRAAEGCRFVAGPFANPASARNAGAREVRTELIGFLDSDDVMLAAKIGCLEPVMASHADVVLAAGRTHAISADGMRDDAMTARMARWYNDVPGTTYVDIARRSVMYTSATLIRRPAFEHVGGYDETLPAMEDWDLYLRLALVGAIRAVDCVVAEYRIWPGNTPWERSAEGIIAVARKHLASLPNLSASDRSAADFALRERLAGSLHTLSLGREVRREVGAALRSSPVRSMRSRAIRRAFAGSFLPRSILERRRPS